MEEIFPTNESEDTDNFIYHRYTKKSEEIWVEKYRPKCIDDIIQQDEIIKVLKNTIKTGELPHLLIYGPPGTGKTSTILAVAMQLFGPNIMHDRIKELNASDDRGINTVRKNIITFAKMSVGPKDENYPCPDFKLVILDEADAMTPEAQAALRKIMESSSGITRFCFICNYIQQILDPISSRCMKFRFKPIDNDAIIKRLKTIAKLEKMKINDKCLNTLVELSKGDVRRSIMCLQYLKYFTSYKGRICQDDIINIMGGIKKTKLTSLWNKCKTGNVNDMRKITSIIKNRNGWNIHVLILHLKDCLINSELNDSKKAKISIELAKSEKRILEGANEYIQILNVLMTINKYSK